MRRRAAGRTNTAPAGQGVPAGKGTLSQGISTLLGMEISCDDCVMQDTPACEDCVVTFICGREPGEAVVIDVAEARAVRLLGEAGLVPPLRRRVRAAH